MDHLHEEVEERREDAVDVGPIDLGYGGVGRRGEQGVGGQRVGLPADKRDRALRAVNVEGEPLGRFAVGLERQDGGFFRPQDAQLQKALC